MKMNWRSQALYPLIIVAVVGVASWLLRNDTILGVSYSLILPPVAALIAYVLFALLGRSSTANAQIKLPDDERFRADDGDAWIKAALQRISSQISGTAYITDMQLRRMQDYIVAMEKGIKQRDEQARTSQLRQAIITTAIGFLGSWIPGIIAAVSSHLGTH